MNLKVNKVFILVLWLTILMIGPHANTSAQEVDSLFTKANAAYMDQKYVEAIELYEELIKSDRINFEVYYNLGNAYYKSGSIPPAILNYERAKLLKPSDADVNYNLRIAYLSTIDKIEPAPQVFYVKWWNDYVNSGSVNNRAILVVVFFWLTFLMTAGYLFFSNTTIRKVMFFGGLITLIVGIFTLYLTTLQHQHMHNTKAAIVFTESAYVKSSPDDKSANLFMLHSGTRIDVIDQLQSWKKIRIANGNEGWIESEALEII